MNISFVYGKSARVFNIKQIIFFSFFLLLIFMPFISPAGEPFSITEISTDYGIAENTYTSIESTLKNDYTADTYTAIDSTFGSDESTGDGTLNITWITPTADDNHSQNTFKEYSFNVTCLGGSCGTVNVTLDPEIETTYTPSTETHCSGGTCTKTLYSGTLFTEEDDGWHTLPEVSTVKWQSGGFNFSYRNYWFLLEPFVIYNGQEKTIQDIKNAFPDVELKEYIPASRFNHKFALNYSNVPQYLIDNVDYLGFRLKDSHGLTWDDVKKTTEHSIVIKDKVEINYYDLIESSFTLNLVNKTYLLIGNISENYKDGVIYLDPTIQLEDADTENLEDTAIHATYPNTNYNSDTSPKLGESGGAWHYLAKFDISSIPSNQKIDSSSFVVRSGSVVFSPDISAHHITNQTWIETIVTWNNHPNYNATAEDTQEIITSWVHNTFNVTNAVSRDYIAGNSNTSLILINESDDSYAEIFTKEYHAWIPYLNITYSDVTYTPKTTINNTAGSTPFYHNGSTIEYECGSVSSGSDCTATFWVNATELPGSEEYVFFATADSDNVDVSSINTTSINITITAAVVGDTCDCPTSGDWSILCSDNCDIQACNMKTNNILISGPGKILSLRNITNATIIRIQGGCTARW